ncbi:HAD family hydrolase [Roseivirga pacifica]|uniref:HAD family hydrolase n=1 Tax=Roseivirga pacifica TaxID=1267423 RepID=UPI003BA950B5
MKQINSVITDLDDTLWDWVTMWHNTFHPFYKALSLKYEIPEEKLLDAFQNLHRKYHTSESSFLIEELGLFTEIQIKQIKEQADFNGLSLMHQYNKEKKENTKLLKGVKRTLEYLKERKVKVIAFTESKRFYTAYRIKHTELDGLIDVIYTPEDHSLPEKFDRYYDPEFWATKKTEVVELHSDFRKPNKEILLEIVEKHDIDKDRLIYIGDKLHRDILMANQANITAVHANYGHNIHTEQYELLRRVTHWTEEDVEIEKRIAEETKSLKAIPDFTLDHSFDEILNLFEFNSFDNQPNN